MNQDKLTIRQLLAILSAGLFSFSGVLIETATNITFPTLMNEFQVSTSTVQWMTTGNLLMMGILIPVSSFLKRRFQAKRLFLTAGILFLSGLIIDIIVSSFPLLLIGRLIQGAGVGIALPMMYNIILEESPKCLLGLMMGCGSFVTAAAPAIGPTFGGIMTQYLNWRFIFVGVLPIIIFAMITGYLCISDNIVDKQAKLDIAGFIFIGISFVSLITGFSNLDKVVQTPLKVCMYFVVGVISIVYFGYREINIKNPLINFKIFKQRSFTFHALAIMFLQMTTLGLGLLLPTYVQIVLGQSATDAGVVLLPGAIIGAVFSPIGGIILDKFGAKKPIFVGVIFSVFASITFIFMFNKLTYAFCIIIYFIYSLGIGLIMGNTMTCALSYLSKDLQADGNATIQALMQLAGGIGTSMSAAILAFLQYGQELYIGTKNGSLGVFIFLTITVSLVTLSQYTAFKGEKKNKL